MRIENDIRDIANQANLKISSDDQVFSINQKLNFKNKSIWGIVFFLLGGIFLILFPFIKSSDLTSKFLAISMGIFLLILSVFTIIRQISDGVKIINGKIMFRYNLKNISLNLDKGFKIKMQTEVISINRATAPKSSSFIQVTHFLQTFEKEIPILNFQMEDSESDNANKLGNKITQLLTEGISSYNKQNEMVL